MSDVLAVTGTVPVPTAGAPTVLCELDELEEVDDADDELVELLDDDVEELLEPPLMDCSALCTAAESSVLTRLSAVWLAMLARPDDRFHLPRCSWS